VPLSDLVGQRLAGRYRLDRLIANGGMAQVWDAEDEVLSRPVAVKLLHSHLAADQSFVARFRAEAIAAARLAHPSIVSIFDTCHDLGREAIVMELVRGTTLRRLLDERHVLDSAEAVAIAIQVADALDVAHRAGLVHRDVKPANILLSDDGRVLVADFGIAKAMAGSDVTLDGMMVGTAKYLAPEQVQGGAVDGRSDIYALGVVLYEALCGRPPFQGGTDAATAMARLHQDPLRPRQVRAGIPRSLEQVVMRCMARAPAERYPSASALRAALLAADADTGDDTRPPGPVAASANGATLPAVPSYAARSPYPPQGRGWAPDPTPRPAQSPSFAQSERSWLVPTVLIVLVMVGLGVAALLLGRSHTGHSFVDKVTGQTPPPVAPLKVLSAHTLDPLPVGDGVEDDADVGNVTDGNPATTWHTEFYRNTLEQLGKPGVGLYLTLDRALPLQRLVVSSPSGGWAAQVYVSDKPGADLASWGQPVAERTGITPGTTIFDLKGVKGSAVLLWITHLGDEGSNHLVKIAEMTPQS